MRVLIALSWGRIVVSRDQIAVKREFLGVSWDWFAFLCGRIEHHRSKSAFWWEHLSVSLPRVKSFNHWCVIMVLKCLRGSSNWVFFLNNRRSWLPETNLRSRLLGQSICERHLEMTALHWGANLDGPFWTTKSGHAAVAKLDVLHRWIFQLYGIWARWVGDLSNHSKTQ
jgi:hypothetical protein